MKLIDIEDNKLVEIVSFEGGKGISSKLRRLGLCLVIIFVLPRGLPFRDLSWSKQMADRLPSDGG